MSIYLQEERFDAMEWNFGDEKKGEALGRERETLALKVSSFMFFDGFFFSFFPPFFFVIAVF